MASSRDAVNNIYKERGNFIVIGLTGRTGSGCTTMAKILKQTTFEQLDLQMPKDLDFKSNDERKYRVIYNYASAPENWSSFEIIEMRSIIASFIFQHEFKELETFIKEYKDAIFSQKDDLIEDLSTKLSKEINKITQELNKSITKMGSLNRASDEDKEKEVKLLNDIQKAAELLKEVLEKYKLTYLEKNKDGIEETHEAAVYTYLFQLFGNNIRASGNAFDSTFSGSNMFDIARRANDFIKAIRFRQENLGKETLICLDAIRNPYEATYFKDRYSAFYLVSINTEDEERRRRLSALLSSDQIDSLDATEYPKKLSGDKQFNNQNIAACLELSDIHIYNPHSAIPENYFLTEQIVKYVMLMKHPGLVTPSHIERCMQIAYNAKLNSGCLSRQVGATITDDSFSVKAVGWNDVPKGQVPCNLRDIRSFCKNKDKMSHSKYEIENLDFNKEISRIFNSIDYGIMHGRLHPYCFRDIYNSIHIKGNQVHTRALHAEENAFLQIVKKGGIGIEGGYLFTTASPCELCSKKAYQLGVKCIYYIDPYPGISQSHILNFGENNPQNPQMQLFYGAIGKAYTTLYSQHLSIKDELQMLDNE